MKYTELDRYAYKLFCDYAIKNNIGIHMDSFIENKYIYFKPFYCEATKILRKQKLNEIYDNNKS